MAFKPWCEQCKTWHTVKEGHRVPELATEEELKSWRVDEYLYNETMKSG